MTQETLYSNTITKSDYYLTGKLYPKLDAYFVSYSEESYSAMMYIASTCQYRTQKRFKQYIREIYNIDLKHIKIVRGE